MPLLKTAFGISSDAAVRLREIKFPVFLPETVHGAQVVIYICGLF